MPSMVTNRIQQRASRKGSGRDGPNAQFVRARSEKGRGSIDITPTKHNSKWRRTQNFPSLVLALEDAQRRELIRHCQTPDKMQVMVAGLTINGRKWKQGMGCEFCMPGSTYENLRVGKVQYFCLLALNSTEETDGMFVVVKEHQVVKRKRRVRYINKQDTGRPICFPVKCLVYALLFVKPQGARPVQEPLEADEDFAKRMRRPWPPAYAQLCALPISPAF